MIIYPIPEARTIEIKDRQVAYKCMKRITDIVTDPNENESAKFVGRVTRQAFNIKVKIRRTNSFRPIITGKFNAQGSQITLRIEYSNWLVASNLIPLLMAALAIKQSGSFVFLSIPIIAIPLWYFLGWIFYNSELKKTKDGMDYIINEIERSR